MVVVVVVAVAVVVVAVEVEVEVVVVVAVVVVEEVQSQVEVGPYCIEELPAGNRRSDKSDQKSGLERSRRAPRTEER